MFYYAQIDNKNRVIGVSELAGEIIDNSCISLDSYDIELIGKKYNQDLKLFEEIPKTKEELLNDERQKYLKLIQEAQLLGETEDVTRLQQEWATVKVSYETV